MLTPNELKAKIEKTSFFYYFYRQITDLRRGYPMVQIFFIQKVKVGIKKSGKGEKYDRETKKLD